MDTTMKLSHHDTPPPLDLDDIRKRNAAARQLLQEWLADASGYDEETWPLLQERLNRSRLEIKFTLMPSLPVLLWDAYEAGSCNSTRHGRWSAQAEWPPSRPRSP